MVAEKENTMQLICYACGDRISIHVAKIPDDCEFETEIADFKYLCPVCAIQAKNATMQRLMLQRAGTGSRV
jgi:hypothetical protein